jgi:hypothetical protein
MESFFIGFFFNDKTLRPFENVRSDIDLIKINQQDNNGDTALHIYCSGKWYVKKEHIRAFVAAGADPELANKAGLTPLAILAKRMLGNLEFIHQKVYEYLKKIIEIRKSQKF